MMVMHMEVNTPCDDSWTSDSGYHESAVRGREKHMEVNTPCDLAEQATVGIMSQQYVVDIVWYR